MGFCCLTLDNAVPSV